MEARTGYEDQHNANKARGCRGISGGPELRSRPELIERTLDALNRTLKDGLVYSDPGAAAYDTHHRSRVLRHLRQRAAALGFGLLNLSTGEIVEGTVS